MTRNNSLLHSLALSALLGLAACGGAEGAVCQIADDCSSGLMCCKGSTSITDRGTCEVTCGVIDAGPRDMSVADLGPLDLGPDDAGEVDAGVPEDLGPVDMSMPVDLGEDGGMSVDLGVDDAGSRPDASAADAGDGG